MCAGRSRPGCGGKDSLLETRTVTGSSFPPIDMSGQTGDEHMFSKSHWNIILYEASCSCFYFSLYLESKKQFKIHCCPFFIFTTKNSLILRDSDEPIKSIFFYIKFNIVQKLRISQHTPDHFSNTSNLCFFCVLYQSYRHDSVINDTAHLDVLQVAVLDVCCQAARGAAVGAGG